MKLEETAAIRHMSMISTKFSRSNATFHALHEGDVFELGNRRVECIEVAGHTPGGICFLDEATKILFSGDACNQNLLVLGCSVRKTLEGLYHLKTYETRYERSYSGHIGFGGMQGYFSQPETILDDCIKTAEQILSGEAEGKTAPREGMLYAEHGTARLSYYPDCWKRIRSDKMICKKQRKGEENLWQK